MEKKNYGKNIKQIWETEEGIIINIYIFFFHNKGKSIVVEYVYKEKQVVLFTANIPGKKSGKRSQEEEEGGVTRRINRAHLAVSTLLLIINYQHEGGSTGARIQ